MPLHVIGLVMREGGENKERFDSFRKIADEELEDLKKKLIVAEELRRKMPQEKKDQVLG